MLLQAHDPPDAITSVEAAPHVEPIATKSVTVNHIHAFNQEMMPQIQTGPALKEHQTLVQADRITACDWKFARERPQTGDHK